MLMTILGVAKAAMVVCGRAYLGYKIGGAVNKCMDKMFDKIKSNSQKKES